MPRGVHGTCLVAWLVAGCLEVPDREFVVPPDASATPTDGPPPDRAPLDEGADLSEAGRPEDAGLDARADLAVDVESPDLGPDARAPGPWRPESCPYDVEWEIGDAVWAAGEDGLHGLWRDLDEVVERVVPLEGAHRVALHPTGARAIVLTHNAVARVDLVAGRVIDARVGGLPQEVALTLDGRHAAVLARGGGGATQLAIVDLEAGTVVDQDPDTPGDQHGALRSDTEHLAVTHDNRVFLGEGPGLVREYDEFPVLRRNRLAEVCQGVENEGPMVVTHDGASLVVAADHRLATVTLSEPPLFTECRSVLEDGLEGRISDVVALPDGDVVAVVGVETLRPRVELVRLEPRTLAVRWRQVIEEDLTAETLAADRRLAYVPMEEWVVVLSPTAEATFSIEIEHGGDGGGPQLTSAGLRDLAALPIPSEALNGVDDDCDGLVDEDAPTPPENPVVEGAVRVSEHGFVATQPSITGTGEDVLLAWVEESGAAWRIGVTRRDVDLRELVTVYIDRERMPAHPVIASSAGGGLFLLAWIEENGASPRLQAVLLDEDLRQQGGLFSPAVGVEPVAPDVTFAGGQWHICYAHARQQGLQCAEYARGGGAGQTRVYGGVGLHALAVSATEDNLRWAIRTGDGAARMVSVGGARGEPSALFLTPQGTDLDIAWGQGDSFGLVYERGNPQQIIFTTFTDRLGEAVEVTVPNGHDARPRLAWTDGAFAVVWVDRRILSTVALGWFDRSGIPLAARQPLVPGGRQPVVAGFPERAVVGWVIPDADNRNSLWITNRQP